MTPAVKKLRPPIKYFGGKSYLARRIIAYMGPHTTYMECCAGGLSVLLNKPRVVREIAVDCDPELINFWRTFQAQPLGLTSRLDGTPYCAESWERALIDTSHEDPVRRAAAFLVRNRMSRGGLGQSFAWSDRLRGTRRDGGPVPGELNAWDTIRADLPAIWERIRDVEFLCGDAVGAIEHVARDGTAMVYADPPYYPSTRTHKKAYAYEMGDAGHKWLLLALLVCHGHVLLSGYRNPLYDLTLIRWERHEWEMPNHSSQTKTKARRTECLWVKPTT